MMAAGAEGAWAMSAEDDRLFHFERAEQCRRMADESTDPAVRRLHVELAEFHEAEARKIFPEVPASEGAE
jgi:hypothetical protein